MAAFEHVERHVLEVALPRHRAASSSDDRQLELTASCSANAVPYMENPVDTWLWTRRRRYSGSLDRQSSVPLNNMSAGRGGNGRLLLLPVRVSLGRAGWRG